MFNQLKQDLLVAQKGGDAFLLGVLKLLLTEISYANADFKSGEPSDEMATKVLFKEAKKRKDAIEVYTKIGSVEKIESETKELEIIEKYLPKLMSESEAEVEIDKIAAESGITGGRLMGLVMGKLKGKVDGGVVQKIVNEKYK